MKRNRGIIVTVAAILVVIAAVVAAYLFSGRTIFGRNSPTDSSLSDVKQRGSLVVGADIPYGVMEFYDGDGQPTGIDIDIAQAIASQLGVSLELKKMPFDQLFGAVVSGEVDVVISAVTITPERQKEMLFSVPYLDAGLSIAVREDNVSITSLEDLKDKKVGVLKGTIAEDLVTESKHIDSSLIVRYQINDKRIQGLLDGQVDAIIVHFLVKKHPSIRIVGEPLSQSYYGIVAKLTAESLMDEINRTLREMKRNGKITEIKQKYVGSDTQ